VKVLMLPIVMVSVIVFVLMSASASKAQGDDSLSGTRWQLVSYGEAGTETPIVVGSFITLEFREGNEVSGTGGCNSYGSSYVLGDGAITFNDVFSTERACTDMAIMNQEQAYLAGLQTAVGYTLSDDQLILTSEKGQQLVFEPLRIPVGSQWQLQSYGSPGDETIVIEGTQVTLEFAEENRVVGSGGCNNYNGTFTDEGSSITFSAMVSTRRACVDENATAQEQAYLAALPAATGYALYNDVLTITYGDDQQLTFTRINPLADSQWELTSIDGQAVVAANNPVTLQFTADQQVGGNGGCNSYGGTYRMSGDAIAFSDVASTLMACMDNSLMEQEQVYFAALQAATRFNISGDQLTITYGDNQQLIFTRAA
jgi:heat shock protein HslJ